MKIVTIETVVACLKRQGIDNFFNGLMEVLAEDYAAWPQFQKSPRQATHVPGGVIELMPICGERYYAYKYVNGHPQNPERGLQTVVAMGMLSDVATGYPLMVSEMTLLTALRTAATTALFARYLARSDARVLTLIGTGAQAEFQAIALQVALGIDTIYYWDTDPDARAKFERNLSGRGFHLIAESDLARAVPRADIVLTATASKSHAQVLHQDWIRNGQCLVSLGGDCPGKTEFDPAILSRGRVFVEYLPQAAIEGEIQVLDSHQECIEMHEVIAGRLPGRSSAEEITVFDSVGFALEDYAVLRYVYSLLQEGDGVVLPLLPNLSSPKDLFAVLL